MCRRGRASSPASTDRARQSTPRSTACGSFRWASTRRSRGGRRQARRPAAANDHAFLVDTGATDSMAPGSELTNVGIRPVGRTRYELADSNVHEYEFGLAQIEFMGEITAGRIVFGPEGIERSSA